MSERLAEFRIVMQLAETVCQRVARRVIRMLQKQCNSLSSDDSVLISAWDEICVQVQDEFWVTWHAYEKTVEHMVAAEIEKLKPYEQEAIWLQTSEGSAWDEEDEEEPRPYPVVTSEIVGYITDQYVLGAAVDWSNQRIERYLQRCYSLD